MFSIMVQCNAMVYYNHDSVFKFAKKFWCLISLTELTLLFMRILLFATSFFFMH